MQQLQYIIDIKTLHKETKIILKHVSPVICIKAPVFLSVYTGRHLYQWAQLSCGYLTSTSKFKSDPKRRNICRFLNQYTASNTLEASTTSTPQMEVSPTSNPAEWPTP